MTKAEIISSILDQARDKDTLANGEADSLISYGHAHPLCANQDGTASRVRCAACIEKWLNAEVNT